MADAGPGLYHKKKSQSLLCQTYPASFSTIDNGWEKSQLLIIIVPTLLASIDDGWSWEKSPMIIDYIHNESALCLQRHTCFQMRH